VRDIAIDSFFCEFQLEELVRENERLKKENDLMESYLRRNSQVDLHAHS
jgi:hypothetical protein